MRSKTFVCLAGLISFFSISAFAAPPNTITLDGVPNEYDDVELVGVDTISPRSFGPGTYITNLFVTWDETYMYFALQGAEVNDKLAIMVDIDAEQTTGATSTTNWTGVSPSYIGFNDVAWRKSSILTADDFGLDVMIASEGFFNSIVRVLYDGVAAPDSNNVEALFDNGNGSTPAGTPVDMVVKADGTDCTLKGIEARIPWSVLYPTNDTRFGEVLAGEVVPRDAFLKVFAVIHNNSDTSAFSAQDIIPPQVSPNANYTNGLWTTDTYIELQVDNDSDGFPDVGTGDTVSPYLTTVSAGAGAQVVYARFNEDVVEDMATNEANWLVGGVAPDSVDFVDARSFLLNMASPIAGTGSLIQVVANDIEDPTGNSKISHACLFPAANAISEFLDVTFVLNINSGFGKASANPRATNFFLNGDLGSLQFDYPPATNTPLSPLNATQHAVTVSFVPGTPASLNYKFSGQLLSTGTNTYEAIRLNNFDNATRVLTLVTNGSSQVVTDYLGAVAAPFRDPGEPTNGYNLVYSDSNRGDAGVRQRTTILFQLDLNNRNLAGVDRVFVQGTDPLRGFNAHPTLGGDFDGETGGIELFDNGTNGDLAPGDGIYSREWAGTTNGTDSTLVPGFPNSLVGGDFSTDPYNGTGWLSRRSPKSFSYKFYIFKGGTSESLESPASDLVYYIQGNNTTNVVLEPFVWDNTLLPLPPPSNSPVMVQTTFSNGQAVAIFTNQFNESLHGMLISTGLMYGFDDFGTRATSGGASGVWQATAGNVSGSEMFAATAGPAQPFFSAQWSPNPVPLTGATVTIYFTQHSRVLAGKRELQYSGDLNSWGQTPMSFIGDGTWMIDIAVPAGPVGSLPFKFRNKDESPFYGYNDSVAGNPLDNYQMYRGDLRATWTPEAPTNGELFTLTYDAAGGVLETSVAVNAYVGRGTGEQYLDAANRPMTNIGGTVWQIAFPIPTNYSDSVNFVFNDGPVGGGSTTWDNENSGRRWRAFIPKD